jgi:hypothetical protein
MTSTVIPLIGSGTQSQGVQLNPSQLINFYETDSLGVDTAKSKKAIVRTPGTSLKYLVPNAGRYRGHIVWAGILYVVYTTEVYSITTAGTVTLLNSGTPITAGTGRAVLVCNGIEILIEEGTKAWTYTIIGGAFAEMADGDYTKTGFITFQATRGIYAKTTDNTIWCSAINDLKAWTATAFSSHESPPQPLVCAFATPTDLYTFGPVNTLVWANTGDVFFPWEPKQGVNIPYGCAARHSICYTNGTIIWLSKNYQGKALLIGLSGYSPQILLDEAATYQLQQLTTISDAKAATFELNGHIFYAITFPTEAVSFLFDTQTKKFIKWQSWKNSGTDVNGNSIYVLSRHLFDDICEFNDETLVFDYRANGAILKLDANVYVEYAAGASNSIYCECISPNITAAGMRVTVNSMELDHEKGMSIYSAEDLVQDPTLNIPLFSVALSKDGGRTFNYSRDINFGYSGDYTTRVKLNNWGQFRNGAVKISTDHPSFIGIYNIWADVDVEGAKTTKTTTTVS